MRVRDHHEQMRSGEAVGLRLIIDEGRSPSHHLLMKSFPNAVRSLAEFAKIDPLADTPWPVEKVRGFWRAHRHDGCGSIGAVMRGEVRMLEAGHVTVDFEGRIMPAFNSYGFSLNVGDTVFTHNYVIVEAERPA